MNVGLSKSKIAAFEQCPKRLWLQVHRPEEGQYSAATEMVFAAGHQVGAIACELLPGGIMIEAEPDISAALHRTSALMASGVRRPLFEATFRHEGVLVRVDILEPVGAESWHVAEVKSTSRPKDYQISDLATQVWVMQANGVRLTSAAIRHLDTSFVLEREGNYRGLFADAVVDDQLTPLLATRGTIVAEARAALAGPEPERQVGDHCTDPFDCPFNRYCRRNLQEPTWPISLLPRTGRKVAADWAQKGIFELTAVPTGSFRNPVHVRIHEVTISGLPFHDPVHAAASTGAWAWPRTWLDFETISFAVPRWVGTRPYEKVPFQFSAHVQSEDGRTEHREFLSLDGSDPRRACAEALVALIPREGAIVTYNAGFERSCLNALAAACPDLAEPLFAMAARVVDLLPVAQRCWYHPEQRGSWSIKSVLPTVPGGLSYADLDVQDGTAAQRAYLEAISCDGDRREDIDKALRAYCGRDTEAMIVLHRALVTAQPATSPDEAGNEAGNSPKPVHRRGNELGV